MNDDQLLDHFKPVDDDDDGTSSCMTIYGGPETSFWTLKCPCGVVVRYPLNGLPSIDTPHPCGVAGHWTIRWIPNDEPAK